MPHKQGGGRENMADVDCFFQVPPLDFGHWKTRKGKMTHSFFPLNTTYVSFLFFFSGQVPQIADMSKISILPPAVFYTAGFTCVVRAQLPILLFPQSIRYLILIGTSHLSSMWCLITPDGPVNLNLDYILESSGDALGGEIDKPTHFQAAPWTDGSSISGGEIQALLMYLKLPSDYNV